MVQRLKFQITLLALAAAACVPIVIHPGDTGPLRPWPAAAKCPVPARSATDATRLIALMNTERAKAGLPLLVARPAMTRVAHAYACEIAARQDISHTGTDGSKLGERLQRGGVTASVVAENTASFYRSPDEVMAAWMASPHHRDNILRASVRAVGIGQADGGGPGGRVQSYWVADFAS